MLKTLRLGMNKAFELVVCKRWKGFVPSKAPGFAPKSTSEFFLSWKPVSGLEIMLSIYPNPKSYWSSFGMSLAWSRSGNFDFSSGCGSLWLSPPDYDIRKLLRSGLLYEKAYTSMDILWYASCSETNNWQRTQFKNFDESYNFPWFPLRSPIHTFNPETQGPDEYKRLMEAEKSFTVDDGVALATPVIEEIVDHIALHIWPFIEADLIPYAETNQWKQD